jgi:hypothetical protein
MSPHKMIPMLRIKSCSDPHRWYADRVGLLVPDLGFDPVSGWRSKERGGYTNYILGQDAVRGADFVPEHLLGRWPYITHETLAAQHAQVKPAATLPPLTCPWACERFGICQALEGCKDKARIDAELARKGVKPPAPKPPPPRDVKGSVWPPEDPRFQRLLLDGERVFIEHPQPTPTGQSRTHSMAETVANIVVGFAASMVIQALVLPAMGHDITLAQNFWITCIFTAASVVRGYGIRRIFNRFQTNGAQGDGGLLQRD